MCCESAEGQKIELHYLAYVQRWEIVPRASVAAGTVQDRTLAGAGYGAPFTAASWRRVYPANARSCLALSR